MKVTTKEPTTKEEFPCLKISDDGTIVLFTTKEKGTVLSVDFAYYEVGHYSESWNWEVFEPYGGEITIEEQPQQKQQYPYLGKSPQGLIVLFTSTWCGVVLEDPKDNHEVGYQSTNWSEYVFERIKGQVILEND